MHVGRGVTVLPLAETLSPLRLKRFPDPHKSKPEVCITFVQQGKIILISKSNVPGCALQIIHKEERQSP